MGVPMCMMRRCLCVQNDRPEYVKSHKISENLRLFLDRESWSYSPPLAGLLYNKYVVEAGHPPRVL